MVLSPRSDAGVLGLSASSTFSFPSRLETPKETKDIKNDADNDNDTDTIPSTDMEEGYHTLANVPKNVKSDSDSNGDNTEATGGEESVEWVAKLGNNKEVPAVATAKSKTSQKDPESPKKMKAMFRKFVKPFGKKTPKTGAETAASTEESKLKVEKSSSGTAKPTESEKKVERSVSVLDDVTVEAVPSVAIDSPRAMIENKASLPALGDAIIEEDPSMKNDPPSVSPHETNVNPPSDGVEVTPSDELIMSVPSIGKNPSKSFPKSTSEKEPLPYDEIKDEGVECDSSLISHKMGSSTLPKVEKHVNSVDAIPTIKLSSKSGDDSNDIEMALEQVEPTTVPETSEKEDNEKDDTSLTESESGGIKSAWWSLSPSPLKFFKVKRAPPPPPPLDELPPEELEKTETKATEEEPTPTVPQVATNTTDDLMCNECVQESVNVFKGLEKNVVNCITQNGVFASSTPDVPDMTCNVVEETSSFQGVGYNVVGDLGCNMTEGMECLSPREVDKNPSDEDMIVEGGTSKPEAFSGVKDMIINITKETPSSPEFGICMVEATSQEAPANDVVEGAVEMDLEQQIDDLQQEETAGSPEEDQGEEVSAPTEELPKADTSTVESTAQSLPKSSEHPALEVADGSKADQSSKKCFWKVLLISVLALVGVIIFAGLYASGKKNSNNSVDAPFVSRPTATPLDSPSQAPTRSKEFKNLFAKLEPVLGTELPPESSSLFTTLEWLAYQDESGLNFESTDQNVLVERFVAAHLFFSTDGENWLSPLNFLSSHSVCKWNDDGRGVFCDEDGRVVELRMDDNNLAGTIPSEIEGLSGLMNLSLERNELFGSLPESIGRLSKLTNLDVGENSLTGTVPESYGDLENIWFMLIYSNPITGTIPPKIATLPKLIAFGFWDNLLTGTLPEFAAQPSITFVSSAWTNITGPLPSSLFELPHLRQLYLLDAQFTGTIATEVGQLTGLEVLSMRSNQFVGTIPTEIGLLTSLTNLELASNRLTGTVPEELQELNRLRGLRIYDNELVGEIPQGISELPMLGVLRFERTNITQDFTKFCQNTFASVIYADCAGDNPEVECPCCTTCCEDGVECYE